MAEQAYEEIPDDWLNDTTDYRRCFVCGADNPVGLHLHYWQEGDHIVTRFTADERHAGFPGVLHGGLISTILDETMGRAALFARVWVMTGRLEVRFREPAPTGQPITFRAWLTRSRRDAFESRGEARLDDGRLLADARGLFLRVPDAVREASAKAHPELGDYFNAALPR